MTWTGTILTDAEHIFMGVDGYFADGVIFGATPPLLVSATPTQVVLRDPDWQGRITFHGTGLTMGTAVGGTVPIFTGGTITSFTVEFNDARRAAWAIGTPDYINNIGLPAYQAQVAATELESNLDTVGTIATGGISAAALGTAVAQSFDAGNFTPLNAYLDQFARNLTGTNGDNGLVGAAQDDVLSGLGGIDRIDGHGGNDLIDAGGGDDGVVTGGAGNDTILGGAGNDTALYGDNVDGSGNGNDLIDGGTGNDQLNGGTGDD
ncbi:calcium-binding protein, partial [Cribrihabitans sp. XS_ASV171]